MTDAEPSAAEAVVERLFGDGLGLFHLLTVYLGQKHGLFAAIAAQPGQTSAQLAAATGTDEWYVREWLQAETIAGLVLADAEDLRTATFTLADGVHAAMVDEVNPAYIGGLAYAAGAVARAIPALTDAFKTGAGVGMEAYGPDVVQGQSELNRPAFTHDLVSTWLPALPDVFARLSDAANPARIADIGCGTGWAAIELAKGLPHVTVDGYDADELSVQSANKNATDQGVSDRVTFHLVDATNGVPADSFDLVTYFECVHDMGRPVEALASGRAAVRDGGTVLVMDERTNETRPDAGDPIETFFATVSVLWCLPQSRTTPNCEAPGTVMRPAQLEAFAQRAGFSRVDVAPIEHPMFRFYRLIA